MRKEALAKNLERREKEEGRRNKLHKIMNMKERKEIRKKTTERK